MSKKENIVQAIKALGYNSRQVSVANRHCGYSSSFNVTVRDVKVNILAVEKAVKNLEVIHRDERSYEILSGGNTFIDVEATDAVYAEWAKELEASVHEAMEKVSEEHWVWIVEGKYSLGKYRSSYHMTDHNKNGQSHMGSSFYSARSLAIAIYLNELRMTVSI